MHGSVLSIRYTTTRDLRKQAPVVTEPGRSTFGLRQPQVTTDESSKAMHSQSPPKTSTDALPVWQSYAATASPMRD